MMRVFVIGLTGTVASGKEVVKDVIKKNVDCYSVSLSAAIRGEIEKKKKVFNRTTMQDIGNELRQKYGAHVLAKVSTEFMPREKPVLVVDGIRNPGEVEWLKKNYQGYFALVAVDAPQQTRFERMKARARPIDPQTMEEFVAIDQRDQGANEPPYGQQVRRCVEMADVVIQNDGDVAKVEAQLQPIFQRVKEMVRPE